MKAYIKTFEDGSGYKAEVVTEQDYHEGGPFARSYLSPFCLEVHIAWLHAENYCFEHNLTIVSRDEI